MDEDGVVKMRERAAQCRRLANSINDERSATILRQMADEIDDEIRRLETDEPPRA